MKPHASRALAALCLVVTLSGCRTDNVLEDEFLVTLAQEANQPLTVVDYTPRQNVPGVPIHIEPYFFFNKMADVNSSRVVLSDVEGEHDFGFSRVIDVDSLGVRFVPSQDVRSSAGAFTMDLEMGGQDYVNDSLFWTPMPSASIFNASTALECTRFGSDPSHAARLNTFFEPGVYPLFAMFVEGLDVNTTFPAEVNLYLGPAYFRPEPNQDQIRIYRSMGFTTPVTGVEVDGGGRFSHKQPGAFFPLDSPEGVALLYLVDVTFAGQIDMTGEVPTFTEMTISGVLPTRFLQILANINTGYKTAVSMLELDVDLNGNGVPDSANFTVRSTPTWVPPENYGF